jgi:cytochrome c oxidase subunit 2
MIAVRLERGVRNAFVLALAGAALWSTKTVRAESSTIEVSAANFAFTPNKVVAHVGEPATLRLTSHEGVHGLASKDLGIETTILRPDQSVDVTFTPTKPGEYEVHCAFVCGVGHPGMKLVVEVEP